jgi:hypothetical protein
VEVKENSGATKKGLNDCQINSLEVQAGSIFKGEKKKQESIILQSIAKLLPEYEEYKPTIWNEVLSEEKINELLKEKVTPHYSTVYLNLCQKTNRLADVEGKEDISLIDSVETQLQHESSLAGMALYFLKNKNHTALEKLFYSPVSSASYIEEISSLLNISDTKDSFINLSNIDPRDLEQLKCVGLSPISVVHLYRQYFFEFYTFLGSPIGHIWLSPGSTVELVEVSTRKITTERKIEQTLEQSLKAEDSNTNKDELS